jgi:two-component system OmpR family response regulator
MQAILTAVVIEDDPDMSDLLTGLLEQCGFAVHVSVTGADGVRQARRLDPDLITTDVQLPGVDGLEAIRRIRRFSDAYILIISASNNQDDVLGGLDAGADDYIIQPFRPRILQARVEALQRRPRRGRPSRHVF